MNKLAVGQHVRVVINYHQQACIITEINGSEVVVMYTPGWDWDDRQCVTVDRADLLVSSIINKEQ